MQSGKSFDKAERVNLLDFVNSQPHNAHKSTPRLGRSCYDDAAYPEIGENRVRHVEAADALAAEFGVAVETTRKKSKKIKKKYIYIYLHSTSVLNYYGVLNCYGNLHQWWWVGTW